MNSYYTDNSHGYAEPPPLSEFGEFRIPDGTVWDRTDRNSSHDNGCVAVAHHPSGAVVLADTKLNLADQAPLHFTSPEWAAFLASVREGRV